MDGVLNINKPAGPTSHDIVADLRRMTDVKRIGHAGTLDPAACGVLLVCLGRATRIVEHLMDSPKAYRATAVLGSETDTEDHTGTVTNDGDASNLIREDVLAVLPRFTGPTMQVPPMVSALRHDGRRLYELAREGRVVERQPRPVNVYSLQLVDFSPGTKPEITFDVSCSRGTYVRTLCADIGRALGCGAYMSSLVRTAVGRFRIEGAHDLDDVAKAADRGAIADLICSIDEALSELPAVRLSDADSALVLNGTAIPAARLAGFDAELGVPLRMHDPEGGLLGIGILKASPDGGVVLKPRKVLSSRGGIGSGN